MVSFSDCYLYSRIFEQNPYFTQYFQPKLSGLAQFNFMAFHFNPDLDHFKQLENFQKDFHRDSKQNFLRFHWPEDEGIYPDTFDYLSQASYQLGRMELLAVNPKNFLAGHQADTLQFESLNPQNLDLYLRGNYQADFKHGDNFAQEKQNYYPIFAHRPHLHTILAFQEEKLVGWIDLVTSKLFVEIHSLYVLEKYRKQGIATALQVRAMDLAQIGNKSVVLIADSEDTPIQMYFKQGYTSQHSLIIAEKNQLD